MSTQDLTNCYLLARKAIKNEEYRDAIDFYKIILLTNPNDWEANFYTFYAKTELAEFENLDETLKHFGDALYTIFSVLAKTPMPDAWRTEFILQCTRFITVLPSCVLIKYCDANQAVILNNIYSLAELYNNQHCDNLLACYRLCYTYCDVIEFYFSNDITVLKRLLDLRKFLLQQHRHDDETYFKNSKLEYSQFYLNQNINKLQKLSLKLNAQHV